MKCIHIIKKATIVFFISLFVSIFIPTEKEIAITYALPKIINSEVIQKDIPELYDLGVKYLKEELQSNKQ